MERPTYVGFFLMLERKGSKEKVPKEKVPKEKVPGTFCVLMSEIVG